MTAANRTEPPTSPRGMDGAEPKPLPSPEVEKAVDGAGDPQGARGPQHRESADRRPRGKGGEGAGASVFLRCLGLFFIDPPCRGGGGLSGRGQK